jgi:hypothetical protein
VTIRTSSRPPARMHSTIGRLLLFGLGLRVTQSLIRSLGFAATVRLLGAVPVRCRGDEESRRWAAEIDAVKTRPRSPSCLDRSVFLWFVLRFHGIDGDVRIGIAPRLDGIDGHAWVELNSAVLNDAQDIGERFAAFDGDPIGLAFS